MRAQRAFDGEARSVRQARRFVAGALDGIAPETAELAVLLVSELVANCVRHAATPFRVTVDRAVDRLMFEVEDGSAGLPVTRRPAPTDPSGRGLRIVDALASTWGVRRAADAGRAEAARAEAGKVVWFELALTG